jgi:hypothetical protein
MGAFRFTIVILATIGIFASVGCKESSGGVSDSSSTGGGTGDNAPTSADKFSVKVITDTDHPGATYLHKFNSFTTACEVSTSATPTDLKCILNVREEDLFFYGLKWEVNFPSGMCSFAHEDPYWYYNYEIGQGPANIVVTLASPSNGAAPVLTGCTIDGTGVAADASKTFCAFPSGEGTVSTDGATTCAYDYTDAALPNCCQGKRYVTINTTTTDSMGVSTTASTITKGDYGGDWAKCLSGPASVDDWPKSKNGYPVTLVRKVTDGFSWKYNVESPISKRKGNTWISNMYGWTNYRAGTHAAATIPKAIQPAVDKSGVITPVFGNESYSYECRDQSGEVKHRIRLYVNEWNTIEEFNKYVVGTDTQGDPNVIGVEGTACQVGSSIGVGNCNDSRDWDDIGTGFPGE